MKIEDVRKKYPDQWVLVEVTKIDRRGNIIEGTVRNTHPLCLDIGSNLILTLSYRKEIKIGEKVQVLIRPNDVEFMTDEKGGKDIMGYLFNGVGDKTLGSEIKRGMSGKIVGFMFKNTERW